jgi:hypothetical protein
MKTLLLVNTGNDGDIIKESLSHNQKYFDKIIVLDRSSIDNTVSEIESLNNLKITIVKSDAYPVNMQPLMNHITIVNLIQNYDYYMILDADEFIVAENLEELNSIPKDQVGIVPWNCYVPDDNVYSNFKQNITKRRTKEPIGCHKVVIPTTCQVQLTLGNHHVHNDEGQRTPHIELKSISLAHFPVRSIEQMNRKIDFFNTVNLSGLNPDQLTHLISKTKIETIEELRYTAINYIETIDGQELINDPI